MATLSYRGPVQAGATDLANTAYAQSLLALNLSQAQIDTLITNGFAAYATTAYVDGADALHATKAYVDTRDATRLHLSQVGVNNGIAGLDGTGRIAPARVNVASTQRWPKAFWSPSAYNASAVTAAATETTVYTCDVSDPGIAYKLLVTGTVDVGNDGSGEYPVIKVRQGSPTGPVVAQGYGPASGAGAATIDSFERTSTVDLGSDWETTTVGDYQYGAAPSLDGWLATPGGHDAQFSITSGANNWGPKHILARNVNAVNSTLTSDYPLVSFTNGSDHTQDSQGNAPAGRSLYGRLSADLTTYTAVHFYEGNFAVAQRRAGVNFGNEFAMTGLIFPALSYFLTPGTTFSVQFGTPAAPWTVGITIAPATGTPYVTSINDNNHFALIDSSHRGWAFGMLAVSGNSAVPPARPQSIASVSASPVPAIPSAAPVIPVSFTSQSVLTGATTLYVTLSRSGTTSTVSAATTNAELYVAALAA